LEDTIQKSNSEGVSFKSYLILCCIVILGLVIPMVRMTSGIRFSDEGFYITGAWRLVTDGSVSIPMRDIVEEGRIGCFFVPGRESRFYSMNPIGFSFILAPIYFVGGWWWLLHANYLIAPVALILLFLVGRRLFNVHTSLLGTLFLAISPIFSLQTSLVMTHVFSLTLQLAGVYVLLRKNIGIIHFFVIGLIWGGGVFVRLDFCLMLIPLIGLVFVRWYFNSSQKSKSIRSMSYWLIAALLGFSLGIACFLMFQHVTIGQGTKSGYQEEYQMAELLAFDRFHKAVPQAITLINQYALPFVVGFGLLGMGLIIKSNPAAAIVLWTWSIPFFLFYCLFRYGSKHFYNVRYFIPMLPAFTLSAGYFLTSRNLLSWVRKWFVTVIVVVIVLANIWTGYKLILQKGRNVLRQTQLFEMIDDQVPKGSVLFLPGNVGLTQELKGGYDVRSNFALLGPHEDKTGSEIIGKSSSGKVSMRLQSNSKATRRQRIPELIFNIKNQYPGIEIYIGVVKRQTNLLKKLYPVRLKVIGMTKSQTENYWLYQIVFADR